MKYVAFSALVLFGATACAGPGGVSPSGGLMYTVPQPSSLVYISESTQDIGIDAGPMGTMNMVANTDATMTMSFSQGTDGIEVSATFDKLNASMTQPMAGALSATESDVEGPLVFSLDKRGRGTVVSTPEVKGSAVQLVSPGSFVHDFFPRLPGGAVNPGETWTDTIQYDITTPVAELSSNSVITYTLVGDTVVDGKNLLFVTFDGKGDVVGSGENEGMEVLQVFSGDVTGMFLWDPARAVMVVTEQSTEMDGTVEIPAAGMPPMPMSVTGSGSARLQGG